MLETSDLLWIFFLKFKQYYITKFNDTDKYRTSFTIMENYRISV